jgi:hypothetical protein
LLPRRGKSRNLATVLEGRHADRLKQLSLELIADDRIKI